jgi:hypothetical protein
VAMTSFSIQRGAAILDRPVRLRAEVDTLAHRSGDRLMARSPERPSHVVWRKAR